MNDQDVTAILERAAGPGDLPAGLTGRVIAGARARRRRRVALSAAGLAVVVAGAGLAVQQVSFPDRPGPVPAPPAAAVDPALLARLNSALPEPVGPDRVVMAAAAEDEELIAVRREPNPSDAAVGGKAAEIWIAVKGGEFHRMSDYLSYDSGCVVGDTVCEELRPTGLGLMLVREQPDGRTWVVAQAPAMRTVQVRGPGSVGSSGGDASTGRAIAVAKGSVPEVWVRLPDGRSYRLAEMPGAVITGPVFSR